MEGNAAGWATAGSEELILLLAQRRGEKFCQHTHPHIAERLLIQSQILMGWYIAYSVVKRPRNSNISMRKNYLAKKQPLNRGLF
jgi:hypothetical protein